MLRYSSCGWLPVTVVHWMLSFGILPLHSFFDSVYVYYMSVRLISSVNE